MDVREGSLGPYPCLIAGSGRPLVVLEGLMPEAGVSSGPMRHVQMGAARMWARGRESFYVNRRPGMPRGITMSDVALEHAEAMRLRFGGPVDLLGLSTGGSIAQQIAAQHPDVVRRLVLISTGCRLGPAAKHEQRRFAARVRAGALRRACAVFAADMVPPGPLAVLAGLGGWLLGAPLLPAEGLFDAATMIEAEDQFSLAGLPVIGAPTLIVAGGRDRFYPRELLEETAALIPGSRLEIERRLGHVSVLWDPRVIAKVLGFLDHGAELG